MESIKCKIVLESVTLHFWLLKTSSFLIEQKSMWHAAFQQYLHNLKLMTSTHCYSVNLNSVLGARQYTWLHRPKTWFFTQTKIGAWSVCQNHISLCYLPKFNFNLSPWQVSLYRHKVLQFSTKICFFCCPMWIYFEIALSRFIWYSFISKLK